MIHPNPLSKKANRTLTALFITLACLSPLQSEAKPYPRLIRNAYLDSCNEQCNAEADASIKQACLEACDCSMTKLQDRFTLEEFLTYLDDESVTTDPSYPALDARAKQVSEECVSEVVKAHESKSPE